MSARFADIVGQARALELLRSEVGASRLPGCYLFVGPPGVGKFTTAFAFAAVVNCTESSKHDPLDACGTCAACRKVESGNHPDVRVISKALRQAEAGRRVRDLTIEQVRPVLAELAYSAYEGTRRVIIFDGAHDLNESAQNALLKSLEEPPPDTTFILVTDQPGRLLPTVRSRSRIVRFGPVEVDLAAPLLAERLELTEAEARVLASTVSGSLGRALGEQGNLYRREAREAIIRDTLRATQSPSDIIDTAEEWSKRAEELPIVLDVLATFFRDARIATESPDDDTLIHRDLASTVRELSAPARALDACFQAVRAAATELRGAAQDRRLVLEHLLMEIGAQL